jgi:hypothetical protein
MGRKREEIMEYMYSCAFDVSVIKFRKKISLASRRAIISLYFAPFVNFLHHVKPAHS